VQYIKDLHYKEDVPKSSLVKRYKLKLRWLNILLGVISVNQVEVE
jgi:hypothetical protein